ncbi:hypothetical protein TIFTF001_040650 [Ficus carica]|uniref:Flavin-containing monooxygenase n=1 Tax=Ficus carica TaxID=3494 RepID=A0AA87YX21_FICCA|nr:hypothetical protein TIFTF001_040650 [Ficus carica]
MQRETYQFQDFPWPSSVKEVFPSHNQVLEYAQSYAQHFGLFPYIKFNSKVIILDYVGESHEEMEAWDSWGGTGKPFESKGKWHILVQDTKAFTREVHIAEFVILCIGRFSEVPDIPEFLPNQGQRCSMKSALDIAAECANENGVEYPCKIIHRTVHWLLPSPNLWRVNFGLSYFTRFSELLVRKPGETFLLSILATLLSPLRWAISRFAESYLRWKLLFKKYGMVPNRRFLEDISSCTVVMLLEKFYDKVEQGSIILKKSQRHWILQRRFDYRRRISATRNRCCNSSHRVQR